MLIVTESAAYISGVRKTRAVPSLFPPLAVSNGADESGYAMMDVTAWTDEQ